MYLDLLKKLLRGTHYSRRSSRVLPYATALLALFLFTGCSSQGPSPSNTISDACTGDNCNACTGNEKCEVGTVCKDKKCVASGACNQDSQCNLAKGEICTGFGATNGTCVVPTRCGASNRDGVCKGDNNICHDGVCISKEKACASLSCSTHGGGVCKTVSSGKYTQVQCADADHCQNDGECRDGKVCVGSSCTDNKCKDNSCGTTGGVCNQQTGQCEDATPCEQKSQCMGDSRYCATLPKVNTDQTLNLEEEEARCVEKTNICKEAGCFGECTCTGSSGRVDCTSGSLSNNVIKVTCTPVAEGHECRDKDSCAPGFVCEKSAKGSFTCQSQPATGCNITADIAEPVAGQNNNEVSRASEGAKFNGSTGVALCGDDVDIYKIPTGSLNSSRKLSIRVEIPRNEVGVGRLVAGIYLKDGQTKIEEKTIAKGQDHVTFLFDQNRTNGDDFLYLKITQKTQEGESNNLNFHYTYYYQIIESNYCSGHIDSLELSPATGLTLSGNQSGSFNSFGSAPLCAKDSNKTARNKIYSFVVKEPSTVEITATSTDENSDILLDVREDCSQKLTSVRNGCVDLNAANALNKTDKETFKGKLDPGTYYIDLYANNDSTLNYTVSVKTTPVLCTPESNSCSSPTSASICTDAGDQTVTVTCPAGSQCDNATGNCQELQGDTCENAIEVTTAEPLSRYYQTGDYHNDYAVSSVSGAQCSQLAGRTAGNDLVLYSDLPAGYVFSVNVQAYDSGSPAIYFTSHCSQVEKTNGCLIGSNMTNGKAQRLSNSYYNDSPETKRVYAIIDYAVEDPAQMPSVINYQASVSKHICEPNKWACGPAGGGRESAKCNNDGSAYVEFKRCAVGCDTEPSSPTHGQCKTPSYNHCEQIADISNKLVVNNTLHGELGAVQDRLQRPTFTTLSNDTKQELCGGLDPSDEGGNDAYFHIPAETDAKSYKVTVTPTDPGLQPMVWITDGTCATEGDGMAHPSCLNGAKASAAGSSVEIYFRGEANHAYGVVVESVNGAASGGFDITLEDAMSESSDLRYQVTGCDGANLKYVDEFNIVQSHACSSGSCNSSGKYCESGNADSCPEAKLIYQDGSSVTGSFSGTLASAARSEVPLSPTAGQCNFDDIEFPQGRDHYYRFDLKNGDYLMIDLDSTNRSGFFSTKSTTYYAFFQKECGNPNSCLNQYNKPGANKLSYVAKEENETIYLVIREKSLTKLLDLAYKIEWKVDKSSGKNNTPGEAKCINNTTLEVYDEQGNLTEYICQYGCERGLCRIKPENSNDVDYNTCSGALLTHDSSKTATNEGGRFLIDRSELDTSAITSCGYSSGEDAFFKVDLGVKDLLQVQLRPLSDTRIQKTPVLWIMKETSCTSNSPVCEGYIARTARSAQYNDPLKYEFIPTKGEGTYIVVFDTTTNNILNPNGKYLLDINVKKNGAPDDCVTSDLAPKCTDNKHITFCENKQRVKLECAGECKTLFGEARCEPLSPASASDPLALPSVAANGNDTEGNRCVDPVLVNHHNLTNGTFTVKIKKTDGTIFTNTSTLSIENMVSDACWFGTTLPTSQLERYYAFKLNKGERLTLSTTANNSNPHNITSPNVQVYLTKGCLEETTCLNSIPYQLGTHTMSITAPEENYYYLVFDQNKHINVSATFDVDWKIETPTSCTPHETSCKDDTTLAACDAEGNKREYTCEDKCIGARCNIVTDKHNTCDEVNDSTNKATIEAPTDTSTTSQQTYEVLIPSSRFSNDINRSPIDFPGAQIEETNGSDSFFKIEIKPKGRLTAQLKVSNPEDKAIIYLLETTDGTCKETARILDWKTWGAKGVETDTFLEPLVYHNNTKNKVTVILVVDTYGRKKDADYEKRVSYPKVLRATVEYPNCDPNGSSNTCDNNVVTYCSQDGFKKTYQCKADDRTSNGSCGTATSCEHPTGDHCADPYDLTSIDLTSEQTQTGDFSKQSNTFDLQPGNSCTASPEYGKDAIYKVKVKAGQTLTAKLRSTETPKKDVALYLSKTCVTIPQSCVVGVDLQWATKLGDDNQSEEVLTYSNSSSSDESVYLVVDSTYASTSGGYELTLQSAP